VGFGPSAAIEMRLHLGGHLNYFDAQQRADFEVEVVGKQCLADLLTNLKIPAGEIFLVSINGEVIALDDAWVLPDDYVQLFPPMGGG
jgi:sulfur carrier protein ThiS